MKIYILIEQFDIEVEILGVFSTEEKLLNYMGVKVLPKNYHIIEKELDNPES